VSAGIYVVDCYASQYPANGAISSVQGIVASTTRRSEPLHRIEVRWYRSVTDAYGVRREPVKGHVVISDQGIQKIDRRAELSKLDPSSIADVYEIPSTGGR
jgi:hypothetical protein